MAKTEPNKAQAIQQLRLDTGLSLSEGKDVIDEIFARVERGEVEKLPSNMESTYQKPRNSSNEGLKTAGKTTGCCLFGIFYIFFGVIFKLTSSYSKKRRYYHLSYRYTLCLWLRHYQRKSSREDLRHQKHRPA